MSEDILRLSVGGLPVTTSQTSKDILRLNVGGRPITTSRSTLTKIKGSLLERMFNGLNPLAPASLVDGAFFIDEDPEVFGAVLTWLRHGVINRKNISDEHLVAAASYFGLDELHERLTSIVDEEENREKQERLESETRWRDFYDEKYEALKWSLEAVANNVKDLPHFLSGDMIEFHVTMAIGALGGGTLIQICRHVCLQQLSENSHTSPKDICSLVLFTLKKMREKMSPYRVFEDERGVWQFVNASMHRDEGRSRRISIED